MAKGKVQKKKPDRARPGGDVGARSLLPAVVAAIACLAGVLDIVLMVYFAGWRGGITLALHDPGKTVFHVFLMPLALWIFIAVFPRSLLSRLPPRGKPFVAGLAVLAVGLTLLATVNDHHDGICDRFPAPVDIADASGRAGLLELHVSGHDAMRAARDDEDFTKVSDKAHKGYESKLAQIRGAACDYFALASPREYWSFVLSLSGALFVILVFWSLLLHLVARKRPSQEMLSAYLVVFALMVPWLFLRAYSEWYLHFGILDELTYTTMYIAIGLAVGMAIILFILNLKRRVRLIAAALLTGIPTILSVFGALSPEWFSFGARVWLALDLSEIVVIYGIFAATIGCLIWYVSVPEGESGVPGEPSDR